MLLISVIEMYNLNQMKSLAKNNKLVLYKRYTSKSKLWKELKMPQKYSVSRNEHKLK